MDFIYQIQKAFVGWNVSREITIIKQNGIATSKQEAYSEDGVGEAGQV